jgi:hypothetical protein
VGTLEPKPFLEAQDVAVRMNDFADFPSSRLVERFAPQVFLHIDLVSIFRIPGTIISEFLRNPISAFSVS